MALDRIRYSALGAGALLALAGLVLGVGALAAAGGALALLGGGLIAARRARGSRRARSAPAPHTWVAAGGTGDGGRHVAELIAGELVRVPLGPAWSDVAAIGVAGGDEAIVMHGAGMLDADSLVEIGSLTKAFTGILLADLVHEGVVDLDDPLDRFLPDLRPRIGAITLLDLTTHTAGLPRLPGALLLTSLAVELPDPYAEWDGARLERSLRWVRLRRSRRWRYSNLGVGLLGHALARAAGRDYGTLVVERVCRPLGMAHTGIGPAPEDEWAVGHDRGGLPVPPWHLNAFAGAGGLRSTPRDMLRFLRAQLDPAATPIAAALEAAQQPRRDASGRERIGLGWLVKPGDAQVHWHNGATGGFSSFLAFDRAAGAGAALLLSTTHGMATDPTGLGLVEQLSAARPEAAA